MDYNESKQLNLMEQLPTTSATFLLTRLIHQYKHHERLVIAYDFDDTVRPYWGGNCDELCTLLRVAKRILNPYLIVYTCNPNHDKIRQFLDKEKIPYDSINENAPFINEDYISGKLYYNLFLDDKAGLGEAARALENLCYLVYNKII